MYNPLLRAQLTHLKTGAGIFRSIGNADYTRDVELVVCVIFDLFLAPEEGLQ